MSIETEIRDLLNKSKKPELQESVEGVTEEITDLDDEDVEGISNKQIVEELLSLDELSKETLGRYIKKAAPNLANHAKDNGVDSGAGTKFAPGSAKKALKRLKGISKATDKLTKEQKELIGSILEELEEEFKQEEIIVDVSEDVNALLNGEELSEEFKTKAATIFEAAVVTRVKEEVSKLDEEYRVKLDEQIESIKEGFAEKVDGYLNYIVEQWMTDNEIALTHGIKNEIMENFVSGIKSVFEQNYVEVPEDKFDVLGEMEEKLALLESKLNETTERNVELNSKLNEMRRASTISEACAGLSDTQVEKFTSLVEELSFEDEETFVEKLKTIRENYFTKKSTKKQIQESFITDEPLEEEVKTTYIDPAMSAYVNALSKSAKF